MAKYTDKQIEEALVIVKNIASYSMEDRKSKKFRNALEIVSAIMGNGIKNL